MASFGTNAVDNLNVLEEDLSNNLNNLVTDPQMREMLEDCNESPEEEGCDELNSIMSQNPILEQVEKEVSEFGAYGGMMKVFGFIFFIIGFLLFGWCSGWMTGLKAASLTSFIGIVFSYLYYNFAITSAVNSFLPPELIEVLGNWITITLNQTLSLILTLGVIFLILTVGLYILHKKEKKPLKKVSSKK